MLLKAIVCEVFTREVCHSVARSPHVVDVEFTEKGAHERTDTLRELVQSKIDAVEASERKYDAILLGFGLCGNSTAHLVARGTPLVIPRAHDCCTIFLGSKAKFKEHFAGCPSCPFSSAGYLERGNSYAHEALETRFLGLDRTYEQYVAKYGEENAKYIFETLHPPGRDKRLVYIEVPETSHLGYAARCREQAEADGKEFVQLPGDIRLLEDLIFGRWDAADFLVVQPGQQIAAVYDWDEIIRAEQA